MKYGHHFCTLYNWIALTVANLTKHLLSTEFFCVEIERNQSMGMNNFLSAYITNRGRPVMDF